MICLGIESSAYVFGVGIVDDSGNILANEKLKYKPPKGSGLIPREAAELYSKEGPKTIRQALDKAGIKFSDIDLIAVTVGPGIGHLLRVGTTIARYLSLKFSLPIVGVNHCIAHLEIAKLLTGFKDPVMLYVSGGNTQIVAYKDGKYRIFGETLDIGVGNLLDTIAREMGLEMPGGPKIEELAKKGKNYIELPYLVKGMDVNFGGILTKMRELIKSGKYSIEDLCYSLQETVFAMLLEASERAIFHLNKKEFVITGGVAANKRLQEMARIMAEEDGIKFNPIPIEFATDNGAMIAWTGILMYKAGIRHKIEDIYPRQRYRVEDVDPIWVKV